MFTNWHGRGPGHPTAIWLAALAFLATGGSALAEPHNLSLLPMGRNGLPTTFIGEAATVALAFAFPALAAGAYLATRGAWRRFGLRGALVLSFSLLSAGFIWAIYQSRPDLFQAVAGLAATRL